LTSRSAHLADNFKVEFEANQLKYSEWMHIGQVPVKSLLRVVTSHSHIDLDVYLYNGMCVLCGNIEFVFTKKTKPQNNILF